jgi:DNA-binding response OmpR family regulator
MPKRLLLIEPEPDIAQLLEMTFTAAGYECVAAEGLADARALLGRDPPPDGIVLAVTPYGTDAPTLCRALKELWPSAPLVVLTTETRAPLRLDCLAAGADRIVMKPFDPETLEADVTRLVEGRPQPAAA